MQEPLHSLERQFVRTLGKKIVPGGTQSSTGFNVANSSTTIMMVRHDIISLSNLKLNLEIYSILKNNKNALYVRK